MDSGGMIPRSQRNRTQPRAKVRLRLIGMVIILGLIAVLLLYGQRHLWPQQPIDSQTALLSEAETESENPSSTPEPVISLPAPQITDFHMINLDMGWYRTSDNLVMTTKDGGVNWLRAEAEPNVSAAAATEPENAADQWLEAAFIAFEPSDTIHYDGQLIAVKKAQAVSGPIGWALAAQDSGLEKPLLVTVDGGSSWHDEVTTDVRAAIDEEKLKQQLRLEESALFASVDQAKQAMRPGPVWTLMPDNAYPGDAVLVRSGEPAELQWQGKTYELKPYKAGYYTYLPIPRMIEPGAYTIGDQTLTIKEKAFDTQYLNVTEEMESMRRNTERIQEDQRKIDAARAESAPVFLFDSEFVIPLEGRLSTPFGYTRYINGVLSSTHMAIDLAVPTGTPIAATNDGVVALAEELYLTGNAIYLDHGMGLFSQYAHLSELHVEAGDEVKKGDIIGLVGSTGFSTGPHLHFTFWANNVPVNPDLFFDSTPFQWMNE